MARRGYCVLLALLTVTSAFAAGGCARSSPVRYYVLNPLAEAPTQVGAPAQATGRLLVEYAMLPKYLDRPQIVVHQSRHEVRPLEFHRWAEPLKDGLTRVLAENLAALLPAWQIITPTDATRMEFDGTLRVRVIRLHAGGGEVRTVVEWHIRANKDRIAAIPVRRAEYHEVLDSDDPSQLIAAFDRGILALSKEIAAALAQPGAVR